MRLKWKLIAGLSLLVASSCSSPLNNLRPTESIFVGGPGDAQLVFRLEGSSRVADYNYDADSVGYLVVRLEHQTVIDGTKASRSAAAEVVAGTATVNLRGMAGGPWTLLASLYDDDGSDGTDPNLLFTARQTVNIVTATSTSVNLLLYKPGDLASLELTPAVLVDSLVISDVNNAVEDHVPLGDKRQLTTLALTADDGEASEQRVVWSSDNPAVAEVNSAGLVVAKSVGKALITATSVESEKTGVLHGATYTFWSEPTIYGRWTSESPAESGAFERELSIYRDGLGVLKWESSKFILDEQGGEAEKSRGRVVFSVENWHLIVEESVDFNESPPVWQSQISSDPETIPVRAGKSELIIEGEVNTYLTRRSTWVPLTGGIVTSSASDPSFLGSSQLGFEATPANATYPRVVWTTSDPSVGLVDWLSGDATFPGTGQVTFEARSLDDPTLVVGSLTLNVGPFAPFQSLGSLVQIVPDKIQTGKWLASGNAQGRPYVIRLNSDATFDATFASQGSILAPVGRDTYFDQGIGVYQDGTSGDLLLTSYFQNGIGNTEIIRYSSAGAVLGTPPWAYLAENVPRGRLFGAGDGNQYLFGWYDGYHYLHRIDSSGTPTQVGLVSYGDFPAATPIGTDGVLFASMGGSVFLRTLSSGADSASFYLDTLDPQGGYVAPALVAATGDSSGRPLLVGRITYYNTTTEQEESRTVVYRLNVTASAFDTSFGGTDGVQNQPGVYVLPVPYSFGSDIALAPDGTILVVGSTRAESDPSAARQAFAIRLTADGQAIDSSFGGGANVGGGVPLAGSTPSRAAAVAVDSTGKIVVVGSKNGPGNLRQPAIWSF